MSADSTVDRPKLLQHKPFSRGHWKIGAGILLVAVVAQLILWTIWAEDRTYSKMSLLFVWPAAIFFFAIWWTFFSGQRWSIRLLGWGAVASMLIIFSSIFAFDGVDGEMIPRWRYRWEPSAKQAAQEFFANQPATEKSTAESITEAEPLIANVGDWPGFRGPKRDGILTGLKLDSDWETNPPKELWRHPVGLGWSGFAIVGDFAFTQEQRGPNECVVCYRLDDGKEVWVHVDDVRLEIVEANGGAGPHATPQFNESRIYTFGGTGLLNCLDARTGAKIWQRNTFLDAAEDPQKPIANLQWGASGSPLVVDDFVIVNPGGGEKKSLIAYDRDDGEIIWAAGDYPAGYASPHFATIHGVPQVVMFHGEGIAGHDLVDGRQFWNYEWKNSPLVNAAQPQVFDDGTVLFGCGYGKGSAKIEVQPAFGSDWPTRKLWTTNRFRPKFNDFAVKDGYVYGLDDSILTCLDVATGRTKWKKGRYGYGQLVLVDDVLLILSEQGEMVQVAATPDGHREITRFTALDPITWNHFAIAHGKLLVRNGHQAACFELAQ